MRALIFFSLLTIQLFAGSWLFAQDAAPQNATSSCTYTDGTTLTIRYSNDVDRKHPDPSNGKVWSPGEVPMLLFTETPVTVANTRLAVGAYSMYVIPDKGKWTLIINKNVTVGAAYDEKQDVVRTSMDTGKLPTEAKQPQVSFGHIAPKVCSIRVDFGKVGAWADVFIQK